MQKFGRKSIGVVLPIYDKGGICHYVRVHANKNLGICDIVLCEEVKKETTHEYTNHFGKKKTKTVTKVFFKPIRRINEVMSEFQGRQFNSETTKIHLQNVLVEILNN